MTRDVNRYKLDDARTPQAVATPTAVATPSATTPLLGKRHRNAILIESDQDSDKEGVIVDSRVDTPFNENSILIIDIYIFITIIFTDKEILILDVLFFTII